MTFVGVEAELFVGLEGVEALVLQGVGAQLVDQSDAAAFLGEIKDDAGAHRANMAHRAAQLIAAIAPQAADQIAGETLRMQPHHHRLARRQRFADDDRQMLGAAVAGAKGDDGRVLGVGQRHPRRAHPIERGRRAIAVMGDVGDADAHQVALVNPVIEIGDRRLVETAGEYRRQQVPEFCQRHCRRIAGLRDTGHQIRHFRCEIVFRRGRVRQVVNLRHIERFGQRHRDRRAAGRAQTECLGALRGNHQRDRAARFGREGRQAAGGGIFGRQDQRRAAGIVDQHHGAAAAQIADRAVDGKHRGRDHRVDRVGVGQVVGHGRGSVWVIAGVKAVFINARYIGGRASDTSPGAGARAGYRTSRTRVTLPTFLVRDRSRGGCFRGVRENMDTTGAEKRILLVEDDEALRESLAEQLRLHEEFETLEANSAAAVLELTKSQRFDLILLDIGLPDMDGREVCRLLRRNGLKTPIIMLTGADTEADTILGLDSGANDYITKPFRLGVLLARIRAQLRQHELTEDAVFPIGPYSFQPGAKLLLDPETKKKIRLTEKETSILKYLYRAGDKVVGRDVLLDEVWGYNAAVATHTLETHIYRLRQKIEADPSNAQILITETGGYRLSR